MGISERQLGLIQESAKLLIQDLRLTQEEAVMLISASLKKELVRRGVTMEALNMSAKSDRTSFIRSVVHHVQEKIEETPHWKSKNLTITIEKFYKILHSSWMSDSG
ncbi:hypothetical protein [Leptospira sp. GIMC2001]|uniref:hypothetical protein n=1 Tax=Leptospira sp. GIMC2001 TaxID=1513297 RepID=UPI00234B7B11|nr:hypothetical protein [Leptospira sp. GIMC2001]WCL50459.1 hypothetical protein O4O04_06460 [Leptospira sp. GIMC2001]